MWRGPTQVHNNQKACLTRVRKVSLIRCIVKLVPSHPDTCGTGGVDARQDLPRVTCLVLPRI